MFSYSTMLFVVSIYELENFNGILFSEYEILEVTSEIYFFIYIPEALEALSLLEL